MMTVDMKLNAHYAKLSEVGFPYENEPKRNIRDTSTTEVILSTISFFNTSDIIHIPLFLILPLVVAVMRLIILRNVDLQASFIVTEKVLRSPEKNQSHN